PDFRSCGGCRLCAQQPEDNPRQPAQPRRPPGRQDKSGTEWTFSGLRPTKRPLALAECIFVGRLWFHRRRLTALEYATEWVRAMGVYWSASRVPDVSVWRHGTERKSGFPPKPRCIKAYQSAAAV